MQMYKLFDTVDKYVNYIYKISTSFMQTVMREHVLHTVKERAQIYVYNPSRFMPTMYKWTYTLVNDRYYKAKTERRKGLMGKLEIKSYIYSTSPHVNSVVDGVPYDYGFKYNGVPRTFVEDANELFLNGILMDSLKSKAVDFYKSNGINAYK